MTTAETAGQAASDDFGAAGHLAAIERMYRDALAHTAFLAQSWVPSTAPTPSAPAPSAPAPSAPSPSIAAPASPGAVTPAMPVRHAEPVTQAVPVVGRPPLSERKTAA